MAEVRLKSELGEEACKGIMVDFLEVCDPAKYRSKIVGYDKHKASNVYIVKKIIKERKRQDGSASEVSSQVRRPHSPRSLQAGPFGFRGNSIGSVDLRPKEVSKPRASVESKREAANRKVLKSKIAVREPTRKPPKTTKPPAQA